MYTINHMDGTNKGDLLLYALSTCVWCKKTKQLLDDLHVEYSYIFVDLESREDQEVLGKQIRKFNPTLSFPTLVINNEKSIVGFKPDEIAGELK